VIGTFKANNPYNSFLLLVYAILLKLPMFLHPVMPLPQQTDGFLFRALLHQLSLLGHNFQFVYPLLTFLLLFTQAITFNQLANEQRLMPKANYLVAMAYLLVTSLFKEWNLLSAPLIINTLLVWVWARMSGLHFIKSPMPTLFNIGMAIGISTFFYFPSIAFTLLIIFGLIITRPFRLSEWLVALFGIITPYYFLAVFVFLTDRWKGYKFPGFSISIPIFYETYWALGAIILVIIASTTGIFYIRSNYMRQLVQVRKSWNLVFLYFIVAIFVPFINATNSFGYWILCAVPLSAFVGCSFLYPQKKWFPRLLHWLMVAFVILFSYFVK
jgi:hypothetical protein